MSKSDSTAQGFAGKSNKLYPEFLLFFRDEALAKKKGGNTHDFGPLDDYGVAPAKCQAMKGTLPLTISCNRRPYHRRGNRHVPQQEANTNTSIATTFSQNGVTQSGSTAADVRAGLASGAGAGRAGVGTIAVLPHVGHPMRAPTLVTLAVIGTPHAEHVNSKVVIGYSFADRVGFCTAQLDVDVRERDPFRRGSRAEKLSAVRTRSRGRRTLTVILSTGASTFCSP